MKKLLLFCLIIMSVTQVHAGYHWNGTEYANAYISCLKLNEKVLASSVVTGEDVKKACESFAMSASHR